MFAILLLLCLPNFKTGYSSAYNLKCNLLEKIESPRIILIGGSNLAFGINSNIIKDSLDINVINYGLHAGIGLKFMIDDVSKYIRDGDILIVVPEYQHFFTLMYGEPVISEVLNYNGYKKISLLNYYQLSNVFSGLPMLIKYKVKNLYSHKQSKIYNSAYFNKFGDQTSHWNINVRTSNIGVSDFNSETIDKDFFLYFIDKLNSISERNMVLMYPPVTLDKLYIKNKDAIKKLSKGLEENKHPFIVDPNKVILSDSLFLDTQYHLNGKGVKINTLMMIEHLKKYIHLSN